MKTYFLSAVIITLIFFCGNTCQSQNKVSVNQTSGPQQNSTATQAQKSAAVKKTSGKGMVFEPAQVVDRKANLVAAKLLIPEGWKIQGGVIWTMDNNPKFPSAGGLSAHFPAVFDVKISDPAGEMQLQVFPDKYYCYATPQSQFATGIMGFRYTRELPGPSRAMTNYLLRIERSSVQGLRVVKESVVKPLHRIESGSFAGSMGQNMLEQVEYTVNGVEYEENIYGTYVYFNGNNSTFWVITDGYGFRAPKGQLQSNMKLFETMACTVAGTKDWIKLYFQVIDQLSAQVDAQLRQTAAISHITQNEFEHFQATQQAKYDNIVQTKDALNEKWGNYFNGVEPYHNKTTGEDLLLPAGHSEIFENGKGTKYIIGDGDYDPRKDPERWSGDWEALTKVE